MIDYKGLNFLG